MALYIIVGGGPIEKDLANILSQEGYDVVLIEKDEDKAKKIAETVNCLVIWGDATNADILKEAKIEIADGIAILTNDDNTNMMISQLAKKFNVESIVVRVNDPAKRELFIPLKITAAISPTSVLVSYFKNALVKGSSKSIMSLANGRAEIIEFPIPEELDGKKIEEIGMSKDVRVGCIYRNGDILIAHGKVVLNKGDVISVIARTDAVKEASKIFKI